MQESEWLIHLAGTPEAGPAPAAGDPVELRRNPAGAGLAAFARDGRRLGRIPPDLEALLAPFCSAGTRGLAGWIAALVPRPQGGGPRVHVRVAAPG
jgi:hypothetical protein